MLEIWHHLLQTKGFITQTLKIISVHILKGLFLCCRYCRWQGHRFLLPCESVADAYDTLSLHARLRYRPYSNETKHTACTNIKVDIHRRERKCMITYLLKNSYLHNNAPFHIFRYLNLPDSHMTFYMDVDPGGFSPLWHFHKSLWHAPAEPHHWWNMEGWLLRVMMLLPVLPERLDSFCMFIGWSVPVFSHTRISQDGTPYTHVLYMQGYTHTLNGLTQTHTHTFKIALMFTTRCCDTHLTSS